MMRLHHNKTNGIFTLRNNQRCITYATPRNHKVPIIGSTIELSPQVHAIMTRSAFKAASNGSRPFVMVLATRFPVLRLLIARIKEVI